MAERDGLGDLQVGEAWHDRIGVGFGLGDERVHQRLDLVDAGCTRGFDPEAEVGRDLVVAGAGGVEATGRFADDLLQAGFHVHVDVFELAGIGELSVADLGDDLIEARLDGFFVVGRDDADDCEHGGVSLRACDVFLG